MRTLDGGGNSSSNALCQEQQNAPQNIFSMKPLYRPEDTELMEWIADYRLGQLMDLCLRSNRGLMNAASLQREINELFSEAEEAMDRAAKEQRELDRPVDNDFEEHG